jgi:hypothetical protein
MKKIAVFLVSALLLALGAGQAFASTSAHAPKTVTVAMHDPGCHSFLAGGKFTTKMTVAGPVNLANFDEKTLKVSGSHGVQLEKVGGKLLLGHGVYKITMVGQAPDDNHLVLVVI